MYEFFVSYSRHDADFARAISEALHLLGVPAWIAEAEILIEGRKKLEDRNILRELLTEAALASRRCLILLSPHALDSEWVMNVEIPPFVEREAAHGAPVIWPVLIGPDADVVRRRWPAALSGKVLLECRDLADVGPMVREVCRAAGVTVPSGESPIRPSSSRTTASRLAVTTEHRQFAFHLDIGTEWIPRPPVGRGMLLNLRNGETDLILNLVVGAMPADFRRRGGTQHIEEANYFADPFVSRRMAFLSEVRRAFDADKTSRGLWEILKVKFFWSATGRQDVLGSHVVNVLGHPHFAYTYRMRPPIGPEMIARKYSVILAPPGGGDRDFEFVFTAGFAGDYGDFLKRIARAESMVRSFRFAE